MVCLKKKKKGPAFENWEKNGINDKIRTMKVTNLGNYFLKPQAPFGWDENEDRKE